MDWKATEATETILRERRIVAEEVNPVSRMTG